MKKGFTIMELTIGLVVLGILISMVFKGRSMFEAARIKADINKVTKVSGAVASYYKKYSRYPGLREVSGSDVFTTSALLEDLEEENLATSADFFIEVDQTYLSVFGCRGGSTGSYTLTEGNYRLPNLCIVPVDVPPTNASSSDTDHIVTETILGCFLEAFVDDKDADTGRVRNSSDTLNFDKCDTSKQNNTYTYTVF